MSWPISRRTFLKLGLATAASYLGLKAIDHRLTETQGQHRVIEIDGEKISVDWEEYRPEGQENIDPNVAVIYLPGWPWEAHAKATQDLPRRLANRFGSRSIDLSINSPHADPESLEKRAKAGIEVLKELGIHEAYLMGHSAGAIYTSYIASQETVDFKVKGVVMANPRGLNPIGLWKLLKVFVSDAFSVGPNERKHKRKVDQPEPEEVQSGFFKSLLRDIQTASDDLWQGAKDRVSVLTGVDQRFSQIKAPVVVLVSDKDLVSEYRKYLPDEPDLLNKEELSLTNLDRVSKKWENLPQDIKEKENRNNFLTKYIRSLRSRIDRASLTRGRERYLQEKVFTSAPEVKVFRSTHQGDHNAVPGPRAEQVAHIVSRIFQRMDRRSPAESIANPSETLPFPQPDQAKKAA